MKKPTLLAAVLATTLSLPLAAQQTQPTNPGSANSPQSSAGQTGTTATVGSATYQPDSAGQQPQPNDRRTRRAARNRAKRANDNAVGVPTGSKRSDRETRASGGNTGTSSDSNSPTGPGTTNPPQ